MINLREDSDVIQNKNERHSPNANKVSGLTLLIVSTEPLMSRFAGLSIHFFKFEKYLST